ncbi:MAG TPA: mannose-1-phosphate guanylyltransferase [Rhodothermales bacterium]
MTYAVIMAGGIGSRFWPESRQARPKQFLNVFGEATLIQNTVARLQGLVPPERCLIVTHERYFEQTRDQLPAVPEENILLEPISRNTAPCIAYAAEEIVARDPDATMIVLPADHVITNVAEFHRILRIALEKAEEPGALVTIGITPTHPETGYGYIQFEPDPSHSGDAVAAYPVRTFAEKPDLATAERFLDSGDFLWNSGMFIWRADTVLSQFQEHLPEAYDAFEPLRNALRAQHSNGAANQVLNDAVRAAFQKCPRISVDYGLLEHARDIYVIPGSFGWSDVGDWRAVYELSDKDNLGNALQGNVIVHNASRCLVRSKDDRLVVLVGIHDLVVVDSGDAVLVCHRESSQQVKHVVDYLHAHQVEGYS